MQAQTELEVARLDIEKMMMGLAAERTDRERRMYLAGHIDCLLSFGHISPDVHETLYGEYCF